MGLVADDNGDRRRTDESILLDVPASPLEYGVASGGDRREIRHRRPGHEAEAGALGQPERVDQPARGHLLDDRRRRRQRVEAGVLVPGARQPIGREGRGHATADDKPEVARPGRPDQPGLDIGRQRLDDPLRILASIR